MQTLMLSDHLAVLLATKTCKHVEQLGKYGSSPCLSQWTHPEISCFSHFTVQHWAYTICVFVSETSPSFHLDSHRFASALLVPWCAQQLPTRCHSGSDQTWMEAKLLWPITGSLSNRVSERKHEFLRVEAVERQPFWVTWQHINSRLLILLRLICVEAFRVHTSTHQSYRQK